MTTTFVTKIKGSNVSIYDKGKHLFKDKDVQETDAIANVFWKVEIDYREWGIKDVTVSVQKVEIEGTVYYYSGKNLDDDTLLDEDFTIPSSYTINDDELIFDNKFCCPQEVDVDTYSKTITIR